MKIKNECRANGVTPLLTVDDILDPDAPAPIKNKYPRQNRNKCSLPLSQVISEIILWIANFFLLTILNKFISKKDNFINTSMIGLIKLYLFKPLITFFAYIMTGISNRSIYSEKTYLIRMFVNCLYFFLAYLCFSKDLIDIDQFVFITFPIIIFEAIVYWVCVHPAESKVEKVYFRMIRSTISSVNENNEMWSTDDEEDDYMHQDDPEGDSCSSNSNFHLQNMRTLSLIQRRKSSEKTGNERMLGVDLTSGGGPFQVNFSKRYKPVFICFIDLVISISFAFFAFIFFLMKLQFEEGIQEIVNFMPLQIGLFMILFFFKFFLNIFYLAIICETKNVNRSKSTSGLFWFRIRFELLVLLVICIVDAKFFGKEDLTLQEKKEKAVLKYYFLFKLVVELLLYRFSVMPAYRRYVY